jgi:hypothetical protein
MLFCILLSINLTPFTYSSDPAVCAGCHMETLDDWKGPKVSPLPLVWRPLANDPEHSCLIDKPLGN